jgi:hypothetical protein
VEKRWKGNNLFVINVGVNIIPLTSSKQLAETSPKFSMFKTKNLPLSAVNNADIPNFTAVRLLMAGTF